MLKVNYGSVKERDMDMLFLHLLSTDKGFLELFTSQLEGYSDKEWQVVEVARSKSDDDGESDITAILEADDMRLAILIEDKIDASARPEQHARYHRRAKKGKNKGHYDAYEVFIVCPEKYLAANEEAQKYEHAVTYEECLEYLKSNDDAHSKIYEQQLIQAIDRAKRPSTTTFNAAAVEFFNKYTNFKNENYSVLDLRTKQGNNGYWPRFGTELGNTHIFHKTEKGFVDLEFPKASKEMLGMESMAKWLRDSGHKSIIAVATSNSAVLRIVVPIIDVTGSFEDVPETVLRECFDAIQELTDIANAISRAYKLATLKKK